MSVTNAQGAGWDELFGGTGQDRARDVQRTSDGGYIVAGYTLSLGPGGWDAWLIRTDADGVKQWDKTFGGMGEDFGYAVRQTLDGGYIIAGATSSFGSVLNDGWLVKIDDPLMTRISLVSPPDEADRVGARRRKRQRLCR